MRTCATPGRVDMRGRMFDWAKRSTSDRRAWSDDTARNMIGWSAGLTFRKLGGVVISAGSRRCAVEIADCTSSAAPSMFRFRSNLGTIEAWPSIRVDVIVDTPAMVENCFSRIDATEDAIVSGLAPGS